MLRPSSHQYAKYAGLVFQIFAVIGVATYLGTKLDAYFMTSNPWFTILLIISSFLAVMVWLNHDLKNKKS